MTLRLTPKYVIGTVLLIIFVGYIYVQSTVQPHPVFAAPASLSSVTFIPTGATWKYLDDGSNQGTAWKESGFDDTGWASGPAQLGYGDGETTTVKYGGDDNNKYVTTYFRHVFSATNPSDILSLQLHLLRDDGAVVYLNGSEIWRDNMPVGPITYTTFASTAIGAPAENTFYSTVISAGLLVSGTNTIAVEIHQANPTSSDISFDFELTAAENVGTCLSPTVRFAVIGDYGWDGPNLIDVATLIKSWNPDFITTVGDNNYNSGETSTIDDNIGKHFSEFIGNYSGDHGAGAVTNNFYPSPGNHDWYSATGLNPYLAYFTLPGNERYYTFTRGPVQFFMLDSDINEPDGRTSGSTQATWLQTELANSTAPWKLVHLHHAPYSSAALHGSQPVLQWPYRQWGASAVLAGHDHTYERLFVNGLPYFVNGLGGRSLRGFGTPLPGSQLRYSNDYGAMLIEASDTCIAFQFINRQNAIIDTYTMRNNPPPVVYLPIIFK